MAMWVACDADRSQPSVQLQNVQSSHASKLREAQKGAAVHPPIHSRQENISVHLPVNAKLLELQKASKANLTPRQMHTNVDISSFSAAKVPRLSLLLSV